jgi:hypothetical protein
MHPKYKNPSQEDPSLSKKSKTQIESQKGKRTNYVSRSISVKERHISKSINPKRAFTLTKYHGVNFSPILAINMKDCIT